MTHFHVSGSLDSEEHQVVRTREQAEAQVEILEARDLGTRLRLGDQAGPVDYGRPIQEEYHIHECDNAGCERRFFPPVPEGGLPLRRTWVPSWVLIRNLSRGQK